jgi:ABC-type polysaccharide/polyol phosphate export permease
LKNQAPQFDPLWKLTLVALAVLVVGHACFYKLRRSFADML